MIVLIGRTVVERTWRSHKGSPNTNNLEDLHGQAGEEGEFVCKQVLLFEWGFGTLFYSKSIVYNVDTKQRISPTATFATIVKINMSRVKNAFNVLSALSVTIKSASMNRSWTFTSSYSIYSILIVTRSWTDFLWCILYVYNSLSVHFWICWTEKNIAHWEQKQLIGETN